MPFDPAPHAAALETAWRECAAIEPFSESGTVATLDEAYAVQQAWEALRIAAGDRILGRKVGLTAKVMQKQFGITEPDYGGLLASRQFETRDGRAEVPLATFVQPKIEGEIAFLLGASLSGPGVTAEQVLDSTEALAVSAEIIDSRIAEWRIKIIDTVADNGSFGGFAVGTWDADLVRADLANLKMGVSRGGELLREGTSDIVLGNPAASVAWLANRLADFGIALEPGSIVLSGSLVGATDVRPGDEFAIALEGREPLRVAFV